MDKEDVVHTHIPTHMDYYLPIKKNEIMPLAASSRMGPEIVILNKPDKDRYYMVSFTCGI